MGRCHARDRCTRGTGSSGSDGAAPFGRAAGLGASSFPARTTASALDPIIGLRAVDGRSASSPLFTIGAALAGATTSRIPKVVQLRMIFNAAIDALIGAIPFAGDLFDFGWKANQRNIALLERHAYEEHRADVGDWLFVVGDDRRCSWSIAALPFVVAGWLISWARRASAPHADASARPQGGQARQARHPSRVFLLSPANCGGLRARMMLSPTAQFDAGAAAAERRRRAARRGLQLRQRPVLPRQARVRAAVRAAAGSRRPVVGRRRARHHAERGPARRRHGASRSRRSGHSRTGDIDLRNAAYRVPLEQSATALRDAIGPDCEVVLLGSIASGSTSTCCCRSSASG